MGGGGREHALAWRLARSPELGALIAAPGNPGIGRLARLAPVSAGDVPGLVRLAADQAVDLVVAGPESPLADGLADRLAEAGVPCFGPRAAAAQLESSKAFARAFCARHRIPAPRHATVRDADELRRALAGEELGELPVVKASGLAGGKGVLLPDDPEAVEREALALLEGRLGAAGSEVVLEERLEGPELSVFAVTDGERVIHAGTASDFKRRFDGDRGPNTGGMGSVSPGRGIGPGLLARIRREVIEPTVIGLAAEGAPYRGVLYAGLMLTAEGPKVLEFNVRFGDPECQALAPRFDEDLLPVFLEAARGEFSAARAPALRMRPEPAVTVILAEAGYPGRIEAGTPIAGLPDAVEAGEDAFVFHAGTREGAGGIETAGGRVIAVTGLGTTRADARATAYRTAGSIRWENCDFRRDIAAEA